MAEGEKLLGGKLAIGELRAEEERDQGSNVECAENEGQLPFVVEAQLRDVVEAEFVPRPPDEELEEHHQGELELKHAVGGRMGHERALEVGLVHECKGRRPARQRQKPIS